MQKLPNATILRKRKPIQNNPRLRKPFQNQNAKKNGNLRSKRNIQITLKNSRTTICKPKTKHAPNRIQNNRIKTSKHRIQTIRNRTQPKKNIQRNTHKKQLKRIRKIKKNLKNKNQLKNLRPILNK